MEIRQFEAFAAVHASGSVTAAARLLDRSQPVVSRQLQDLEQELGFTLFTRTRPQVTLTEQGRQFLEEVRNVLTGLQQLEARSREIAQGRSRPLRIAASLSLGNSLAPAALAELLSNDDSLQHKLHLDVMPATEVVAALIDGQVDLAFTSLPLELDRCRLHWSAQAGCMVALPASHPLADEPVISSQRLLNDTVITPSNASRLRHRLSTALLHPSRPEMYRCLSVNSTMSALMMVRAGLGVALIDPCLVAHVHPSDIVYRQLDAYVPYLFGAITHADRPLSADALRIIDAVRDYAFHKIPHLTEGDESGMPVVGQPPESEAAGHVIDSGSNSAGSVPA